MAISLNCTAANIFQIIISLYLIKYEIYTHISFRVVSLVDFDPADVFRQLGVVDRCVEEMGPQSDFRFLGFQRSI